ncbi:taste receptor type 2 member 4-like [Anomaloglossus baeobatrachus]|uniref:taste receptor type 2 member 4-like n=1 Tax=Anomaloglossus baeobatrachus TaxID=238106 RepID=UPI003F5018B3
MADSTEVDTNFQYLGILVLAIIALILGLVIHSFIIGVNVNDWWKGRSVTSVDHVVTSLGMSRMGAQCANTMYFLLMFFLSRPLSDVMRDILDSVYAFCIYSNIWLTSLLSIVFCLKITNLRTRLFLYLRKVIVPRTVHFIVASGLLSAFSCLMPKLKIPSGEIYNTTMKNQLVDCIRVNFLIYFSTGASIPMIFYFTSSILLFSSLYHHTVKMKRSSNLSINLETHYSAMKLVFVTFIYNTTFFTGYLFGFFYYNFLCVDLKWLHMVLNFLPTVHSSYMIYRTARLKRKMSKILQNYIDFLYQRKGAETSNI